MRFKRFQQFENSLFKRDKDIMSQILNTEFSSDKIKDRIAAIVAGDEEEALR